MRSPIVPNDHVIVTLIADGPNGEPFPHYVEGTVLTIHDDYLTVWDHEGQVAIEVKRERVITDDQMGELKRRFLRED